KRACYQAGQQRRECRSRDCRPTESHVDLLLYRLTTLNSRSYEVRTSWPLSVTSTVSLKPTVAVGLSKIPGIMWKIMPAFSSVWPFGCRSSTCHSPQRGG